jgi:hypothetical protein
MAVVFPHASMRARGNRTPAILISAHDDPREAGHGTDVGNGRG